MKHYIIIDNKEYTVNISTSNEKMGKIPSFSVEKGIFCPMQCKACYCDRLTSFRKKMNPCLEENTRMIKDINIYNIDLFASCFAKIIKSYNCRIFRFNVVGDLSGEYLDLILRICDMVKDVDFYLYTKHYDMIKYNIVDIRDKSNLIVNLSIMSYDMSYILNEKAFLNADNIKYFISCRNSEEKEHYIKNYKVCNNVLCPYDKDKSKKCVDCCYCFNRNLKVVFNEYKGLEQVKKIHVFSKDEYNYINKFIDNLTNSKYLKSCLLEACFTLVRYNLIKANDLNVNKLDVTKIKTSYTKVTGEKINGIMYVNNNNYKYKIICCFLSWLLARVYYKSYKELRKAYNVLYNNTIYNMYPHKAHHTNDVSIFNEKILENRFLHDAIYVVEDSYPCKTVKELINIIKSKYCYKDIKKRGLFNVDALIKYYFN